MPNGSDLRMEVEGRGFYLEPLTEQGLAFVNVPGEQPHYQMGDHVEYPMATQDIVIHLANDKGLVLDF